MKVTANGIEIHCMIEGDGPWVTLSHPLATDLTIWDAQAKALTSKFRVLRFDTRGHGQSSSPAGPYTLDQLADDVHGLFSALRIAHTHWVGLSMGGMIGQTYALKHPGTFDSMILADTTSRHQPDAVQIWGERIRVAAESGMNALADGMLARWFTERYRNAHPEVMARIVRCIKATSVTGYAGCCHAIAQIDVLERLPEITCPVLVMAGEEDAGTPPSVAQLMHERLRSSELLIIPSAAHLSHVEQPQAFNQAMLRFLTRVA